MAVTVDFYNHWLRVSGLSSIDMSTDTFVITLHNNYSFNGSQTQYSQVAATEIPTGDGYTQQNKVLANQVWAENAGLVVFDADDIIWTATDPGTIGPATSAIIYDSTTTNNLLMCNIDFGGSETATNGADFQIIWNVNGIYTGSF